jgi:hypothetical protein
MMNYYMIKKEIRILVLKISILALIQTIPIILIIQKSINSIN